MLSNVRGRVSNYLLSPAMKLTLGSTQTLGTALGDWMADKNGLGYEGGAPCIWRRLRW